MATHEHELTEPVDLALADGRTLNPAARGWSRRPLHRANLHGGWGRTKRWDYWAILAGDLVVSSVYADVDYLGLADVSWIDLATGNKGGKGIAAPLGIGLSLPDVPGTAPLRVRRRNFDLEISDDADGSTHLRATWRERGGAPGHLHATVALPPGHESLNVVIPWSERRFQFTSKHQARAAHGTLTVGDRTWAFGDEHGVDAWGACSMSVAAAGRTARAGTGDSTSGRTADGRAVGLQLGGKWTEDTGFTENGVLVDGRLTKLGDELRWDYDWDEPLKPWQVADPSGRLQLVLTPRYDKHTKVEAGVMGTEAHQVFGTSAGSFTTDAGNTLTFDALQGFAEESRSRW